MTAFRAFLDPNLKQKAAKNDALSLSLKPTVLKALTLYQFRAYGQFQTIFKPSRVHVITGSNGAGKTTILEALSLLLPGKGLRQADTADLIQSGKNAWSAGFLFDTEQGIPLKILTGFQDGMRTFKVNDENITTLSDLYKLFAIYSLTPQMDKFFISDPSYRRKFFDRLVFSFHPAVVDLHLLHMKTLKAWSFHLKSDKHDAAYLETLEKTLAETGSQLTAYRLSVMEKLSPYLQEGLDDFPSASLSFSGYSDAFNDVDSLKKLYQKARFSYPLLKDVSLPHLMTVEVFNNTLNLKANLCSTGEQKSLLVSLLFSQISCIKKELDRTSVLLLDDTTAHLDERRQRTLYQRLLDLETLTFLTGTEKGLFKGFDTASFYHLDHGELKTE